MIAHKNLKIGMKVEAVAANGRWMPAEIATFSSFVGFVIVNTGMIYRDGSAEQVHMALRDLRLKPVKPLRKALGVGG